LVFQPPSKPSHINSTKYIVLPTSKGNMIPAFYFDRSAHLTVLVSHGNAEDLGESRGWIGVERREGREGREEGPSGLVNDCWVPNIICIVCV
jgi:hypothetical protein